jgi:hypothetical protein
MVSTRRSKNSDDSEGSTVTVGGSSVANDGSTSGFPTKHQQLQQLPIKNVTAGTATTDAVVPRHHHHGSFAASAAAAPKVLAVVVAKKKNTTTLTTSATSRTAATTTTTKSTTSKSGQTGRRKTVPIHKKTTTTAKKQPSIIWKKGRAGVSNKMLALQRNPNITIVQYTTGVLYLHKGDGSNGNRRRVEYVQTK